ncbi:hypothetical protein SteCoe_37902 [Stentor coeruleus]|uniref:Uncharacterized protein n=1 Tax=Stentor coeruleus TaxID=5963 RepID=A0A1R2AM80_9CILI|nr:hypothetical protein SteCoe_37902 [Stentor coeruleus]
MKIIVSSDLQKFTPKKQGSLFPDSEKDKENSPIMLLSPIFNLQKDDTYNTNHKGTHRKTKSCQIQNSNSKISTPSKSRFDPKAIPSLKIDLVNCKNQTRMYNTMRQKKLSDDKRGMNKEWSSAKKLVKQIENKEAQEHELHMTSQRLEFNKMLRNKAKEIKVKEKIDKIAENRAFYEAKKKAVADIPSKTQDYFDREREKSILKQKELIEKRDKEKLEREEKRREFIENMQAKKKFSLEEEARLKKEREFEYIAETAGRRNLSYFYNAISS